MHDRDARARSSTSAGDLAACTEEPGFTTRTFLSPPMRDVHGDLRGLDGSARHVESHRRRRATCAALRRRLPDAPRLFIGSHLDTVPHAGAVRRRARRGARHRARRSRWPAGGCRSTSRWSAFRRKKACASACRSSAAGRSWAADDDPAASSRTRQGVSVREAIAGLRAGSRELVEQARRAGRARVPRVPHRAGPRARRTGPPARRGRGDRRPVARRAVRSPGAANHAGTTPMASRRDALAGAAEWILAVERLAMPRRASSRPSAGSRRGPARATPSPGSCLAQPRRAARRRLRHGARPSIACRRAPSEIARPGVCWPHVHVDARPGRGADGRRPLTGDPGAGRRSEAARPFTA